MKLQKKIFLSIFSALLCTSGVAYAITPDSSGNLQKKVKVSANDTTAGYLNGKLVAGGNITLTENSDGGNETYTIAATGSTGYVTVQDEGTPLTQRATTNFIGAGVSCVDNAGNTRTNCTISGASNSTVEEGDVSVSTVITDFDFTGADFDVTESPSGEANVSLSSAVVTLTGTQTLTNKTLTTPIIASISNSGTVTLPTGAETLVGRATTDTLTNKTYDGNSTGNDLAVRRHATDCTALTDGVTGEPCYEQDADTFYVCEPTAGACDTAAEWRQVVGSTGYATIRDEGSGITARTVVNFTGAGVSCADTGSISECTIAGSGSATSTVQADDSTVDAAVTTFDFLNDFTITSSPAGEANISIKTDSLDYSDFVDAMTADPTHVAVTNTNYLRLGDGSSNYSMFGTNGALTYVGTGKPNRTIVLTPSSALSPASNGATKANTDGTNFSYPQASFSGTGSDVNSLYWTFYKIPNSYDDGTIACTVGWKTTSTTTSNVVVWQIAASGRADAETLDTALGSFATVNDSPTGTANQLLVSGAATVTTNFTNGEYVIIQLKRDAAHASDTETAAAVFLGMACEFLASAETD